MAEPAVAAPATPPADRPLPPVMRLAVVTLALVVVAGVYVAATGGTDASLAPAVALAALATVVLVVNVVLLSRARDFAWGRFRQVLRGALLAYVVISGILLFVFLYDGTSGATLGVVGWLLVLYALDVPLLYAFSVARYQDHE